MNMQPGIIRVLAADDHPLIREGISAILVNKKDISLVAEASDGQQAVEQFRLHRPDVTLMDLQMPGMSGIEATCAIREEFPDARIIVLTTYLGDALVQRALSAGCRAYVLKSLVRKDLVETIRAVHRGQRLVDPEAASALACHSHVEPLSTRELAVLELIATGGSNRRIAEQLFISEDTVKTHIAHILGKLSVSDRTQAVTVALKRGIISI